MSATRSAQEQIALAFGQGGDGNIRRRRDPPDDVLLKRRPEAGQVQKIPRLKWLRASRQPTLRGTRRDALNPTLSNADPSASKKARCPKKTYRRALRTTLNFPPAPRCYTARSGIIESLLWTEG
jgi:hypothetical protein